MGVSNIILGREMYFGYLKINVEIHLYRIIYFGLIYINSYRTIPDNKPNNRGINESIYFHIII